MRTRSRSSLVLAVLAIGLALVAASCAVPLGDLGGPSSMAIANNNAGVIVGVSEVPGSTPEHYMERAFKRSRNGTVTELASLPGSSGSAAVGINDAGQVAGMVKFPGATPLDETLHAVGWDADGTIHDLGPIGTTDASVRAIDAQGRIIGFNDLPSGSSKAFVYDPAVGHMADLPDLPGGGDSRALGMNDVGDVVGYQWAGPDSLATPVRWDLDAGTVTDLTPAWGLGLLIDINDDGTVVGLAQFPASTPAGEITEAAILRSGESEPTALGAGEFAFAVSINDDEVVVGWDSEGTMPARAFRWTSSTGAVVLMPDEESYAWSVNDGGQIVGQSEQHAALFVVAP